MILLIVVNVVFRAKLNKKDEVYGVILAAMGLETGTWD
jgi:hypothetical protein